MPHCIFDDIDRPRVIEIAVKCEPSLLYDLENAQEEYDKTCALEDDITPDYKKKSCWTKSLSSVKNKFRKIT